MEVAKIPQTWTSLSYSWIWTFVEWAGWFDRRGAESEDAEAGDGSISLQNSGLR